MKTILLIAAATMAAAMMAPGTAYAQKKKAQKRENHEFSFELPVYVEELKKELTYPLAWGNSGIKDFDEWRAAARKKVQECMMAAPRRAASFDAKTIAEERRDGYTARKVEFNVNAYSRITAYILVPDGKGPFPAVNVLHDHGGHLYIGKEKMVRPFAVDTAVVNDADRWAASLYGGQYVGDNI